MSPYLFAVYSDKLCHQLDSARVRLVVIHVTFSDDTCVFSSSISGLQCLLSICEDYATEHEIAFNTFAAGLIQAVRKKQLFRTWLCG